jgi:hypothetical protein
MKEWQMCRFGSGHRVGDPVSFALRFPISDLVDVGLSLARCNRYEVPAT